MKVFVSKLFNTSNKSLLFFVSIGLLISVLWILGEPTLEALMYHRQAISDGQYWRFISGHLVHSNGWHLLLNISSLIMIGLLFNHHLSIIFWIIVFVISAFVISATYFWYAPEFDYYVGLSAVLYAVIIIGALLDLKEQPFIAALILIVVTGRVIWQQYAGSIDYLTDIIDSRVAIESHLFGIISGYLIGIILVWRQRLIKTSNTLF
ncbi:MAG: rhombosortase [Gammaproteobacteria bacterium]|nr:rhombosortase [Gammaproteobacteria bacterium]